MKRKAESQDVPGPTKGNLKKRAKTALSDEDISAGFRKGLLAPESRDAYSQEYAASEPYKHCVIPNLINDSLLRSVRDEIQANIHFTPKETDIYKILQSGDLANLDGLEDAALEKLPNLLRLRDVLYSNSFRTYIATITGSGALSGKKTDMAINVYVPGCHLLCHDDVIGSRRVSYILYLTDPDLPWKAEWGGALRLYPTKSFKEDDGEVTKVPDPHFSKVIPPAWNQLSFFAVQPGESFHDVEEVYYAADEQELADNGGRIRMAISGWYHIPQLGEDGYVKGAEEKWGAKSSLMQLQGNPDNYDSPRVNRKQVDDAEQEDLEGFDATDLEFLLKYMAPDYLTPDVLDQVTEQFSTASSITLENLLSERFASKVKAYIESQTTASPDDKPQITEDGPWRLARPPHKHRFLYYDGSASRTTEETSVEGSNPIRELVEVFLPSSQFRQWMRLATGCRIADHDILARRFRKSLDYALATGDDGEGRLEIGLGLTPSKGWPGDVKEGAEEEVDDADKGANRSTATHEPTNGGTNGDHALPETVDYGGHVVYMAADDEDVHADAAVYKASSSTGGADDDSDSVLFTMPPSWNTLSIVLRDSGVLRFSKYLSRAAPSDRWDVLGTYGIADEEGEEEEDEQERGEVEEDEGDGTDRNTNGDRSTAPNGPASHAHTSGASNSAAANGGVSLEDSEEEDVFKGFPDSEDSDSD